MRRNVPKSVKRLVAERADFRCEYCRVHVDDSFLPFEIDHIISIKHGGGNEDSNLAFACPHCNQHKGSDIATILLSQQEIVSLFNPRTQEWSAHFSGKDGEILPQAQRVKPLLNCFISTTPKG